MKATIDVWLSDPEGNEANVGSLEVFGIGLFVSICLDDAFALLLCLEPFFDGMNWFVPPDGVDGNSRASSSAVNSLSTNSAAAAEVPAPKLKIG